MNIANLIAELARDDPDGPAIVGADGVIHAWAGLGARVARVAGAIVARGMTPGDRVALLAPNGTDFFECLFGIAHAGLIAVPLNYRLHAREVAFQIADSGARLLLVHDSLAPALTDAGIAAETIVLANGSGGGWNAEIAAASAAPMAAVSAGHVLGIFYTGGTTGAPKGVQLTHGNLRSNADNVAPRFGYRRDDVVLHAAPMFHLADLGATMAQLRVGAAHAFLPGLLAAGLRTGGGGDALNRHDPRPDHGRHAAARPDGRRRGSLASLRLVLYGGGPIGEAVLSRALARLSCDWIQGYGQTEATHTVCFLGTAEHRDAATVPHRLRSCGKPIAGIEVQLGDDDGRPVPTGEVGEVQVKGPIVMKGYWQRPEETRAAFAAGWLKTGDLGRMDADGYIYLVDRKKDMIVTGAENVFSAEVENVLGGCPGVVEAAVIGVPDETWGERVHAVVVAAEGSGLDLAALQRHCRAHLAGYKVPKSASFVDALPKTAAGKIAKSELRRPFWEGRNRAVG